MVAIKKRIGKEIYFTDQGYGLFLLPHMFILSSSGTSRIHVLQSIFFALYFSLFIELISKNILDDLPIHANYNHS